MMRARGYVVRLTAGDLDETFIGTEVLLLPTSAKGDGAVLGVVSDYLRCTPDTAHCTSPNAPRVLPHHTHLWLGSVGDVIVSDSVAVLVAPPEVALEPESVFPVR